MSRLDLILQRLHDSEINAGVQSFFDSNWSAWLGDAEWNGISERTDGLSDAEDVAKWLDEKAKILYPESNYAKEN